MRAGVAISLALAAVALLPNVSVARDYGQSGQLFPIVEPDLLTTISGRLARLQASGEIDRANARFAQMAEARIRRPTAVSGIAAATRPRSWLFDPTIAIDRDVRDERGNVVAARGQRLNPLDYVSVRQALVFVDGDDADQLDWATRRFGPLNAKIIFVAGSPVDAMTRLKRRFYFDQDGRLVRRFGIVHTPATVVQEGRAMRVAELALRGGGTR